MIKIRLPCGDVLYLKDDSTPSLYNHLVKVTKTSMSNGGIMLKADIDIYTYGDSTWELKSKILQ